MGFAIMFDKVAASPTTVHKDSCKYYTNRKQDATTIIWCETDTLDNAVDLAVMLADHHSRCKRGGCCLDGEFFENVTNSAEWPGTRQEEA